MGLVLCVTYGLFWCGLLVWTLFGCVYDLLFVVFTDYCFCLSLAYFAMPLCWIVGCFVMFCL